MKIAIITITDGQNYGNRLQNYAMQQLLKKTGANVCTLQRRTSRDIQGRQKIKANIVYLLKTILRKPRDKWRRIRKKRFQKFNEKYICFSEEILEHNEAPDGLRNKYDYFLCGSDQVWNAHFDIIQEDIKNYLVYFARPEQKVAYAASFGGNNIASGYEKVFARYLNDFKAIGVREESGVKLVKQICSKQLPKVVLDPTMMLEKDEWEIISKKPQNIQNEKFIVTYFLGGRDKKINSYINEIEGRYQCQSHNLDIEFKLDKEITNPEDYIVTPDEFVWLIEHAECVLTDSFHATVFAILFHKPFCVFERKASEVDNNMGSRIETLLSKFDLLEYGGSLEDMRIYPGTYDIAKVEKILRNERKKSWNFLRSALELPQNI